MRNLKIVLLALFGVMMAQGVVWYTAHFYSQFYLERILKIDSQSVNLIMITVVIISAPLYIFFARLSDTVGRKPVMLFGMLLMLALYFPGFHFITQAGNPALARAAQETPVSVIADPADCTFQLDLTGGARQFPPHATSPRARSQTRAWLTTPLPANRARWRASAGHDIEIDSVSAVNRFECAPRGRRSMGAARN